MKSNTRLRTGRAVVVVFLLGAVLLLSIGFIRSVHPPASSENNNPDKFYLRSTGSSFTYTFTYDPHAADAWLFRAGGSTRFSNRAFSGSLENHTNPLNDR